MKGITTCNRASCQKPLITGATYYNSSTDANYCPRCAFLINEHNPGLCVLVREPLSITDKEKVSIDLKEQLLAMYPTDGLCSSRNTELVTRINKFSSYLYEIENNKE